MGKHLTMRFDPENPVQVCRLKPPHAEQLLLEAQRVEGGEKSAREGKRNPQKIGDFPGTDGEGTRHIADHTVAVDKWKIHRGQQESRRSRTRVN